MLARVCIVWMWKTIPSINQIFVVPFLSPSFSKFGCVWMCALIFGLISNLVAWVTRSKVYFTLQTLSVFIKRISGTAQVRSARCRYEFDPHYSDEAQVHFRSASACMHRRAETWCIILSAKKHAPNNYLLKFYLRKFTDYYLIMFKNDFKYVWYVILLLLFLCTVLYLYAVHCVQVQCNLHDEWNGLLWRWSIFLLFNLIYFVSCSIWPYCLYWITFKCIVLRSI